MSAPDRTAAWVPATVLEVQGVTKRFPGVVALDDVTLRLRAGSIHALLGENGAGKSTLIKILTGVYQPDGGQVLVDGAAVRFASPLAAASAGIAVVHQERNLIPEFDVGENIALQVLPNRRGIVDREAIDALARRALAELDVDIDPATKVRQLPPAQRQLVEIAKALALDARVVLLDEPTASLTNDEAERLFTAMRRLAAQGRALVFVSHKLEEVFAHCDTATILRDGHTVVDGAALAELTRGQVVEAMVGREHLVEPLPERYVDQAAVPRLEIVGVSTPFGHRDVSFAVRPGEIVALYGLVGAGRTELARSIVGLAPMTSGEVRVDGTAVAVPSLRDALHRYGIGYVTENRKEEGLFGDQTVARNVAVTVWRKLTHRLSVSGREEDKLTRRYIDELGIRVNGPSTIVGTLSGGNQQKVSLAKWLAADCRMLIIDEPTVGIDVRTKRAFHELINSLAADRQMAVLLISSDLTEVVTLADRILVMHEGRITGEVAPGDRDYSRLGRKIIELIHPPTDEVAAGAATQRPERELR